LFVKKRKTKEKKWQRAEEVAKRRRSDKEQKNQRAEVSKNRISKE